MPAGGCVPDGVEPPGTITYACGFHANYFNHARGVVVVWSHCSPKQVLWAEGGRELDVQSALFPGVSRVQVLA